MVSGFSAGPLSAASGLCYTPRNRKPTLRDQAIGWASACIRLCCAAILAPSARPVKVRGAAIAEIADVADPHAPGIRRQVEAKRPKGKCRSQRALRRPVSPPGRAHAERPRLRARYLLLRESLTKTGGSAGF